MTGLLESLLPGLNDILSIRESIGVQVEPISICTRTWSGTQIGEGTPTDVLEPLSPIPANKVFSHDVKLKSVGAVLQGDILLQSISKSSYPTQDLIDCTSSAPNIERFYVVKEQLYTVITIKDMYLTWEVVVRRRSDQSRYS